MGGVGLPRAADIAPAAFLANIIDTLPIIRNIFQNQWIEMADVPGTNDSWHELHHILNEDEPPLLDQVTEILKQVNWIKRFIHQARRPASKNSWRWLGRQQKKPNTFSTRWYSRRG